jgi:hypothetical protein
MVKLIWPERPETNQPRAERRGEAAERWADLWLALWAEMHVTEAF